MYLSKANHRSGIRDLKQVQVSEDGSLKLAIVSDTHSAPYAGATELIAGLHPNAILHAGDIGDLHILDQFAAICPVYAVRGNIDQRLPTLPDVLVLEIMSKEKLLLRILMLHVGLYGPKLQSQVIRKAKSEDASLVICGHSHVPFIGSGHGYTVFNPGSMGPRRNGLPIVFGILELNAGNFRLSHVDCETGLPWRPPVY
ncbi:MAG: metallophosphoesterase family protein [Fibrobacter sp.]|jgi:putative phosphoesterase|nr:metallophosphoesterase family protein [Fibrobacter sp.]